MGQGAIPASPDRGLDAGLIGALVAWYPLGLWAPDDPRLAATLAALQVTSFHAGAFFQPLHFGGWGTYLNMHIAQCLLQRRDPAAWNLIDWLFRHASPTYTWPEAIHPQSGGGAYGDGAHGWASADWLLLLRNACLFEEGRRLVLGTGWPAAWFATPGEIQVEAAPTRFGPLDYTLTWTTDATATLTLAAPHPPPDGYEVWLPFPVARIMVDDVPSLGGSAAPLRPASQDRLLIHLPSSARRVQIYRA